MKKLLFIFIAFYALQISAQDKDYREKIKAMKTAFLTTELDLSSEEAAKFWPIYNVYDKKMFKLQVLDRRSFRKRIENTGNEAQLTEQQAKEILDEMLANETAIAQAKKDLKKDLQEVISNTKILKLFKAEHDFNRKLIREYRSKRKK